MEILHWNWTENQYYLFFLKLVALNSAESAFLTVLVQYAVSEWIWFGDEGNKRRPHRSPVYLVSSCVFFFLWSTIFNSGILALNLESLPLGYVIATPIVAIVGGVLLNLAFCWIWTIVFPEAEHFEEEEEEGPNDEDQEPLNQDMEALPPKTDIEPKSVTKEKPKVLYINNIKIFLTAMVILVHVIGFTPSVGMLSNVGSWSSLLLLMFQMPTEGYFMHLFFFFSGYFVPRSFDKKGTRAFLMGRTRRLGIPLILYAYLLQYGEMAVLDYPFSIYNPLHTWFLLALMIYGIVFAFACGKGWSPKIACPTMIGFLASSIVLGLTGFVLALCFGSNTSVLGIPYSPGCLPAYTAFFFFGAVAQRNNWMEDIKSKSRIAIYSWAFLSWAITVGLILIGPSGLGLGVDGLGLMNPLVYEVLMYNFVWGGFLAVPMSLAVTVFFMDLLNKKFFFTDFFAQSMYTVYIIHKFPIFFGSFLWSLIFAVTPANMVIPAFLFIGTVSMIVVWPLAYAIRSIPGFAKVL